MHTTGFQCFSCSTTQPRDFAGYTCPACGGNLDITYDYDEIRRALGEKAEGFLPRGDIFRYGPLLPIEDVELASPLRVGFTPLYYAERLGQTVGLQALFLKDDGLNPSASFKDRASAVTLVNALETGATVVAGASTGNAGSSMACMCASVGVPCVIFVPEKAPPAKIAQLLTFGAHVLAIRGSYDQAFDLCTKVCEEKGWFNRNTGFNPITREGKKTCSFELIEQLDGNVPDHVLVPTGDGNIISGIWKGFRDLIALGYIDRVPRLHCVQAEGSAAIAHALTGQFDKHGREGGMDWSKVVIDPVRASTVADSICVDAPRDGIAAMRAVSESGGEAVIVSDEEMIAAIGELAQLSGVFAEPSAAATWVGAKKLASQGEIASDELTVCLISGSGLKDVAAARKGAGEPIVVDNDLSAVIKVFEDQRI